MWYLCRFVDKICFFFNIYFGSQLPATLYPLGSLLSYKCYEKWRCIRIGGSGAFWTGAKMAVYLTACRLNYLIPYSILNLIANNTVTPAISLISNSYWNSKILQKSMRLDRRNFSTYMCIFLTTVLIWK